MGFHIDRPMGTATDRPFLKCPETLSIEISLDLKIEPVSSNSLYSQVKMANQRILRCNKKRPEIGSIQ